MEGSLNAVISRAPVKLITYFFRINKNIFINVVQCGQQRKNS